MEASYDDSVVSYFVSRFEVCRCLSASTSIIKNEQGLKQVLLSKNHF